MSEQTDNELYAALEAVGAAIEAMPHDERHAAVDDAWDRIGLNDAGRAREFVIGVFVQAHDQRLAIEDMKRRLTALDAGTTEWGVRFDNPHGSDDDEPSTWPHFSRALAVRHCKINPNYTLVRRDVGAWTEPS